MASPITVIKSHGIDITGDYVVNSISSSGNVSAGNVKTDHLLYANGTPYVFTTNAAGSNTQLQFNDDNSFAGSANLTFDKTSGTLTANFFVGDGSGLTGLPASYTDTNANSAIDARVTKAFVDNLNVDADTLDGHDTSYFATSTQGGLADTAVQPGDNVSDLVNDAGYLVAANLSGYATETYVGDAVANLINSAPGVLDTLGEIANAIGNDASFITTINNDLANKADTADLSSVALTGNYEDLNNLPTLFSGSYTDLTNKPSLFDGEYSSLANTPALFDGTYANLTGKPTLFSGSYIDLTDKPTLFDGTYANLTGKPTLSTVATSGSYTDLVDKPTLFSGSYLDLTNTPTLFDGEYSSLANKPSLFSGSYTDLTDKPSIPSNTSDLTNDSGFITTSALTGYATESYVGNAVANLVNSAPSVLDTLGELATALGNDASYATTITNALSNKLSTTDFTSTADTWLATKSTSDITEGTNQYYTVARANTAIDNRVTKAFVENLGINSGALVSATPPSSPTEGELWIDSDTGDISVYFGGAWAALTTQSATAQTVTANAQPNITSVGTLTSLTVSGNVTANYFIGNGSQLTGLPAGYTDSDANSAIDAYVTKSFVDNLGVNANTLNGHSDTYFATSTQGSLADSSVQPGDNVSDLVNDVGYLVTANISTAGISGNYEDLNNLPTLFSGSYTDLTNKPSLSTVATSGSYTDLTNKPTLFDGEYSSLANKPTLFSGSYVDLTNKPTLGTAAATDSSDYATAAQGAKADTALQPADLTGYATESYVGNAVANLVNSAPSTLDTLQELANALGNDASYSTTITTSLGNKLNTSDFTSTADTWLATKSTTNVAEGTNQYYTVARANSAIDARVTKSFVETLGANANVANTALSVTGANVTGQVGNALVAGTVYTNAQPNITSVGSLSSLTVTGTVSLSDITKLYIPGGTNNYVLKTDGAGNLSWTQQLISGNAVISGSNTQVFFNNGSNTLGASANLIFNTASNTLTTTNLTVSKNTNLGAVGNITITGGSTNNYLKTDGAGTLSWAELPSTSVTLDAFTGNGVQTQYTLTTTPTSVNYTLVAVAGVLQPKSTYSVSGTTLTFSEAPPDNAPVEVTTINSGVSAPSGGGSSGYTYQGISANTTLASATKYIVNTSASALTLTLPSSASLGDEISIIDGTGTASTNNITINPNGGNIMGASGNMIVSTNRAAFTLVYYNAPQGWLLTQV